jgi:hypothetical protein
MSAEVAEQCSTPELSGRFWTQVDGNIDDHAVGQLDIFQEIENPAAKTRLDFPWFGFGAGFGFSARFGFGASFGFCARLRFSA